VIPHFARRAFGAAAAVAVASTILAPAPAGAAVLSALDPGIEWEMPDRFGIDADHDGLIDMPNEASYVAGTVPSTCDPECPPPAFPVRLTATLGDHAPPAAAEHAEYRWTVRPEDGPSIELVRNGPEALLRLPEGPARITLRVVVTTPFGLLGRTTEEVIDVEDLLVVAIGDSYASGEGNPERHRGEGAVTWGDGLGATDAAHAAARRSSVAWPAQVALDLERSDPTTSVTFVSLASSGATVAAGLLGRQSSAVPDPQVEAAARLVGGRQVDLLLVSVGGNDIGFTQIITGLVDADPWLDPVCYENDLENVWASVADGVWDRASHLSWSIGSPFRIGCRTGRSGEGVRVAGMDGLAAELDRMSAAIDRYLGPRRVVITEYPDPTGYTDGGAAGVCGEIVGDAAPLGLHEIDRREQLLGRSKVVEPLNSRIREAAARHDWTYVGGITDAFADGHGYCAVWPDYREDPVGGVEGTFDDPDGWYRNGGLAGTSRMEGPVSWYRTAAQSAALQGPKSRLDTTGTLHPNELGHRAIADLVLAELGRP
jgi:lysophospholipase L1-like esterase